MHGDSPTQLLLGSFAVWVEQRLDVDPDHDRFTSRFIQMDGCDYGDRCLLVRAEEQSVSDHRPLIYSNRLVHEKKVGKEGTGADSFGKGVDAACHTFSVHCIK